VLPRHAGYTIEKCAATVCSEARRMRVAAARVLGKVDVRRDMVDVHEIEGWKE